MDLSIADSGPKPVTPISMLTSAPDLKVTPFPFSEGLTRLLKLKVTKTMSYYSKKKVAIVPFHPHC
jgi:hypothetical protein